MGSVSYSLESANNVGILYINLIEKAAVVHSKQIGAQQGCDILPHCNVNNKHDGCRVRANLHLCFTCCPSRSMDISAHNNFGPCQFRPITKSAYTISAHRYNNV